MAEHMLEGLSQNTAMEGVQAGQTCLTDPFSSALMKPFMKAECGKTARSVVCPAKAGMFSRVKPAGVKVRARSVDSRGDETETLKPIDKVSLGEIYESPAVTKVNALWPRK